MSYIASFLLFASSMPSSTLRSLFFFCCTHFLGFPLLIFVILSIQSCPSIQHFDSGFIPFFHLHLAFLIIPITPLFLSSCHRTTSQATVCHHFLDILPLSLTCCLILIILLLPVFSNPLPYFFCTCPHNFRTI